MAVAAESITGQSPVCSSCLEPRGNCQCQDPLKRNVPDTLCPFFFFLNQPEGEITAHVYQPKQLMLHLSVFHSEGEECCFSCFFQSTSHLSVVGDPPAADSCIIKATRSTL